MLTVSDIMFDLSILESLYLAKYKDSRILSLTQGSSDKVKWRSPNKLKSQILFYKKSSNQDFVTRTLVSPLQRGADTKLQILLDTTY